MTRLGVGLNPIYVENISICDFFCAEGFRSHLNLKVREMIKQFSTTMVDKGLYG